MKLLLPLLLPLCIFANPLVDLVKKHEGFVPHKYTDRAHTSIGYGINLNYGITEYEAELLLVHRLGKLAAIFEQHRWYNNLSTNRKHVIISMAYQLGLSGFYEFKHFVWRVQRGYYDAAANAMQDSLWYRQSGLRSRELVRMMRNG